MTAPKQAADRADEIAREIVEDIDADWNGARARADATAAIASAIRSTEPQWRPIESAPLDGTPVLLYCRGVTSWNRKAGMPDIVVGLWAEVFGRVSIDGGKTWFEGAWFSDIGDVNQGYESTGAYFEHEYLRPTHWMPLPAPPAPPEAISSRLATKPQFLPQEADEPARP